MTQAGTEDQYQPPQARQPEDAVAAVVARESVTSRYTLRQGVIDEERRLIVSLPCHCCGYELKRIGIDGVCPECGCAVTASLVWKLMLVDRAWLRSVSDSVCWINIVFFSCAAAGFAAGQVLCGLLYSVGLLHTEIDDWLVMAPSTLFAMSFALIFTARSVWKATQPEQLPNLKEHDTRGDANRKLARYPLVAGLCIHVALCWGLLLWQVIGFVRQNDDGEYIDFPEGGPLFLFVVLSFFVGLFTYAGIGLFLSYLASLAGRMNRPRLRSTLLIVPWLPIAGVLALFLLVPFMRGGYLLNEFGLFMLGVIFVLLASVIVCMVAIGFAGGALSSLTAELDRTMNPDVIIPRIPSDPSAELQNHLSIDLACFGCSYNLRRQSVTGVCPECGHPVQASLRRQPLSLANKPWLSKISTGIFITAIGLALNIVMNLTIALFGTLIFMGVGNASRLAYLFSSFFDIDLYSHQNSLFSQLSNVLILVGAWRTTIREPVADHTRPTVPKGETLRQITRAAIIAVSLMGPVWVMVVVLIRLLQIEPLFGNILNDLTGYLFLSLGAFTIAAKMLWVGHQRELSLRLPESRTSSWLLGVMIALPVPLLMGMVVYVLSYVFRGAWYGVTYGPWWDRIGGLYLLHLLVSSMTTLAMLIVTVLLARELRRVARSV